MLDVAELLDNHEAIDTYGKGVANAVDVVAGKVDEHDVLSAVLERAAEFICQSLILLWRLAALDGAGDGVRDDAAVLALDEQFGRRADDLEVFAVDVEQIRRWIDGPEVSVNIEGVEAGRPRKSL